MVKINKMTFISIRVKQRLIRYYTLFTHTVTCIQLLVILYNCLGDNSNVGFQVENLGNNFYHSGYLASIVSVADLYILE
jgi:hypothetical protein